MARIEASCECKHEACYCLDEKTGKWVDILSHLCRYCENAHATTWLDSRWGHGHANENVIEPPPAPK